MADAIPESPVTKPHDVLEAAGLPEGAGLVKDSYDPRLANEDLAPLKKQGWGSYSIFAFWMSDVHSVGGYVTAGSLFALGLASWQVLVALVVGIVIVQVFTNLVAKPSQKTGVPYPVINRAIFGVKGANIPAIIRGLIAVAWYGVQTFLASEALNIIFIKFIPGAGNLADVEQYGFLGLSALGWISYAILWVAQALVFWNGMETIRKFIDWAGPAVYVVMIVMAVYLVSTAVSLPGGWSNISLELSAGVSLDLPTTLATMAGAVAIVVSYFSGPMLNFGDFSRYGKSFTAVKKGNFWGLPVNFLFFSLLTVICASATVPIFGELITDPIHTVERIDTPFAIILGGLTFVTATVGINIVANFISPAFDFSNVNPQKISWRTGGMIAAVGSVILTPWNWYSNADAIHYTLGILGALIGPLFGILIAGYYVISRQRVVIDEMFTMNTKGRYWFTKGYNSNAVWTTVIAGAIAIAAAVLPKTIYDLGGGLEANAYNIMWLSNYSWFIGCGLGYIVFIWMERMKPQISIPGGEEASLSDGTASEDDEVNPAIATVTGTDTAEAAATSTPSQAP